jgi:hypothetical protein
MFGRLLNIAATGEVTALRPRAFVEGSHDEAWLRDLLFRHPEALPAFDVDPAFADAVPICRELRTPAGQIDALFTTPTGAIVILECKLWRNPQSRREVVAQILDYAKELARWRYEDLQRAVSEALRRPGENALFRCVLARHPGLAEAEFVDRVSRNLSAGRFLLLIVGDGIQEGTEAIARYVAAHAGLHFTLGLVEVAGYETPGGLIVQPRVLARTVNIERAVVRVLQGGQVAVDEPSEEESEDEGDASPQKGRTFPEERKRADRAFWQEFRSRLRLDDPAVPPPRTGWGRAYLDIGSAVVHLTLFSARAENRIGAFARFRKPASRRIYDALCAERDDIDAAIEEALGSKPAWHAGDDECAISLGKGYEGAWDFGREADNLRWLLTAANAFVNALRPRILAIESMSVPGGG